MSAKQHPAHSYGCVHGLCRFNPYPPWSLAHTGHV